MRTVQSYWFWRSKLLNCNGNFPLKSFKLKDYTTANGWKIFVSPDFAPKQPEENTTLVDEVKSRRPRGEHGKIKYDSIICLSSSINSRRNLAVRALKLYCLNARSIAYELPGLQLFLSDFSSDIFCITETSSMKIFQMVSRHCIGTK